jgi:hypothetical protein
VPENTSLTPTSGQEDLPAARIRKALDRYQSAGVEWVAATLELATELWRARLQYASDNAFSDWLAENELNILTKDERAALIGMGKNGTASKRVLETTSRRSIRHIWLEEIKPSLEAVSPRGETKPVRKPEIPNTGVESEEDALARAQLFHAEKVEALLNQLKSKKLKYHLKMADIDWIHIEVNEDGDTDIKPHARKYQTIAMKVH